MSPLFCPWESATFLFVSSNVPLLINYSHFIAIFSALAVSLLIFVNNPKALLSRLFVFFAVLFSVWALLDVALWATNDPAVVMFAWSLQVLLEPLVYAIAFFLVYIYFHGNQPPLRYQLIVTGALLPLILLLPTTLNLEALQLSSCESIEGPIAKYYTYFLNLLFTCMILAVSFRNIPLMQERKRSATYFSIGLVTFLLSFTSGNIISSFTDEWTLSQYGLFGMPLFAALIAYSVVRFNAFRAQIAGAQVIVAVLWALVCSLLFVDTEIATPITLITLGFTSIAGFLLIRSVRQEFQQRQEIEALAQKLQRANKRLKQLDQMKSEFVSIASHQLRSPLTSIRGYTSMLLEGTYGKVSPKAQEVLQHIADSSRFMALSVEDYLNVSRIQSGNMKYEYSDFNLKDLTESVVDELRPQGIKKGILLTFKSDLNGRGIVNADIGKTKQVIQNIIDNSMKYTPKGSVDVRVRDDKKTKKVFVEVTDTGIGMSEETLHSVFDKFERAHNANEVNVTGTGLGLFVARTMAQAMKGDLYATSEGEGRGSTFTIELPLAM
ncbi:hypothetical protein H6783_02825 [Candidatus Nomurabacteria bacterium]|nr:hypothetical protein [Candidatus Nomurabacteria bacterium]